MTTATITGIKCGHCQGRHGSVAEVRSCSASKGFPTSAEFYQQEAPKPAGITQDGMYRNPESGEIFKVQWNRGQGDGKRLYAKQLIIHFWDEQSQQLKTWTQIPLDGEKIEGVEQEFQYAPGITKTLRPEWRMSMEEAKAFGALYGTCMCCGRTLTREDSIERAMGSTCAKKANWA